MTVASRLLRAEGALAAREPGTSQPACRRRLAERLYHSSPAALGRFLDDPGGQDGELGIDLSLRQLVADGNTLRVLTAPEEPRHPLPSGARGIVIPPHDERFGADPDTPPPLTAGITLPLLEAGGPLLVWGQHPPDSWGVCRWLAGYTGPGTYVAMIDGERRAVRVDEHDNVEERPFGGTWQPVGTFKKEDA